MTTSSSCSIHWSRNRQRQPTVRRSAPYNSVRRCSSLVEPDSVEHPDVHSAQRRRAGSTRPLRTSTFEALSTDPLVQVVVDESDRLQSDVQFGESGDVAAFTQLICRATKSRRPESSHRGYRLLRGPWTLSFLLAMAERRRGAAVGANLAASRQRPRHQHRDLRGDTVDSVIADDTAHNVLSRSTTRSFRRPADRTATNARMPSAARFKGVSTTEPCPRTGSGG